jgi:hypothetical protein
VRRLWPQVPRRQAANGHLVPQRQARLRLRLEHICDVDHRCRQKVLGAAELGAAITALSLGYEVGAQMAALQQQLATATLAYAAAVGGGGGCGSPPVSGLTPGELADLLIALDGL